MQSTPQPNSTTVNCTRLRGDKLSAVEAVKNFDRAVNILSEYRDPADLAEFFYDIGVRGHKGKCSTCPVANFIACAVGPDYRVVVDPDGMCIANDAGVVVAEATSPPVVEDFIDLFDATWREDGDDGSHGDIYERLVMEDDESRPPLI